MISFVVIGKNEGWKLGRCLSSIYEAIEKHRLDFSDVIYVDSGSTDSSLEIAKEFHKLKILLITGEANAAIARNIGGDEAKNLNLFFVDGDMEIHADFIPKIFDKETGLKYPFCSGNWVNHFYDDMQDQVVIKRQLKKKMESDSVEFTTGGLFAITKDLWNSVGGMKTNLRRSQDWDLALRLAQRGSFLYRLKDVAATHHTISPHESVPKMWKMVFNGFRLYRVEILRNNFTNYYAWKHFARINYTMFILVLLILIYLFLDNYVILGLYLVPVFVRTFMKYRSSIWVFINGLLATVVSDIYQVIGVFFFWPRSHDIVYKRVR